MTAVLPFGRKACHIAQLALCFDAPPEPRVLEATPNTYGVLVDHCVIHRYAAPSRLKRTPERHKDYDDYVAPGYSAVRDYRSDFLELQIARYRDRWYWSASSQCHHHYWGGAPGGNKDRTSTFAEARQRALDYAFKRLRSSTNSSDPSVEAAAKRLLVLVESNEYKEHIL